MKIYHYDSVTGEYLGAGLADASPLEPDTYLVPAFATTAEPPSTGVNEIAVFEGGWKIIPDWRGTKYWLPNDESSAPPREITKIGETPPPDALDVPPPMPRGQIVATVWEWIKGVRDRRSESGGYKVGDKWFHSDQKSRSQQLGLVLLGANIPPDLWWKTMDGSFVTMTPELANQILVAAVASDLAIFTAAEAHKAVMETNADPASYDFSSGWPETFEL